MDRYLIEKISEQIILSGLTRLQISLDAFTSETYEKIRQGLLLILIK